jgi:hypothetical protein
MSSISSISNSSALIQQLQQAAATRQAANSSLPGPSQQVQSAVNDPDQDGDVDGGGIDVRG